MLESILKRLNYISLFGLNLDRQTEILFVASNFVVFLATTIILKRVYTGDYLIDTLTMSFFVINNYQWVHFCNEKNSEIPRKLFDTVALTMLYFRHKHKIQVVF